MVPEFFGRSEVIHAASASMLTSLTAYVERSSESRRRTSLWYGKALDVLRRALDRKPDHREILAATSVLVISTVRSDTSLMVVILIVQIAESAFGPRSWPWVPAPMTGRCMPGGSTSC